MVEQMVEKVGFVHLHVHTAFSLREGAIGVGKLLKLALADGQPAVAVTDANNLFGALEISEKFAKDGVQPIVGCQLTVDFDDARAFSHPRRTARRRRAAGPISCCWRRTSAATPISCGWSPRPGLRSRQGDSPHVGAGATCRSRRRIDRPERRPDRTARPRLSRRQARNRAATGSPPSRPCSATASMSKSSGTGWTARERSSLSCSTSPTAKACRWSLPTSLISPEAADYDAHDALMCIADGALVSQDNRRKLTPEHRFKTRAEMLRFVRRSARGDPQQRRDRAALLLPAAHAKTDPAQFRGKSR